MITNWYQNWNWNCLTVWYDSYCILWYKCVVKPISNKNELIVILIDYAIFIKQLHDTYFEKLIRSKIAGRKWPMQKMSLFRTVFKTLIGRSLNQKLVGPNERNLMAFQTEKLKRFKIECPEIKMSKGKNWAVFDVDGQTESNIGNFGTGHFQFSLNKFWFVHLSIGLYVWRWIIEDDLDDYLMWFLRWFIVTYRDLLSLSDRVILLYHRFK